MFSCECQYELIIVNLISFDGSNSIDDGLNDMPVMCGFNSSTGVDPLKIKSYEVLSEDDRPPHHGLFEDEPTKPTPQRRWVGSRLHSQSLWNKIRTNYCGWRAA